METMLLLCNANCTLEKRIKSVSIWGMFSVLKYWTIQNTEGNESWIFLSIQELCFYIARKLKSDTVERKDMYAIGLNDY